MPAPLLPTGDDVRRLAARLVSDEVVVVPVRHHSPACARAVEAAFARHRPSAVLVEGPRGLDPLVPLPPHAAMAAANTTPETRIPALRNVMGPTSCDVRAGCLPSLKRRVKRRAVRQKP